MKSKGDNVAVLRFPDNKTSLCLFEVGEVKHETAFGRVAFAVPSSQLQSIQDRVKSESSGNTSRASVITELVSLDTPGKAQVQVVILGDPV